MRRRRVTPQIAAITAYSGMWESLTTEAQKARRSHRPLTAGKAYYWARIVLRAVEAEENDPEPSGLEQVQ